MKSYLFVLAAITGFVVSSCDKVKNPYPKTYSTLDWSLYPGGDSATYAANGLWPSFTPNTNTQRNVLIEDFTGHRCFNCPTTTANMHNLMETNPDHIFGVTLHSGATGVGPFQETHESDGYVEVFYNDIVLEIGTYFGGLPGTSFSGNPAVMVNRTLNGPGMENQFTTGGGSAMVNKTNACLASQLKVNMQSAANYFPSTRGLFVHVEVDKIDASLTNELAIVAYVVQDSLVAMQLMGDLTDNPNYEHRDIVRGSLDNQAFGRTLTPAELDPNGKYYINYSYHLPEIYEPEHTHVVLFVRDKVTHEIYQVIKQHF